VSNPLGWNTTVGSGGKAHFWTVTGKTACADRKGIRPGATLGDLFTRPLRPTAEDDHVCFYCAQKHPRVCVCWSCVTRRQGGLRP
jgi:hypothetical protein